MAILMKRWFTIIVFRILFAATVAESLSFSESFLELLAKLAQKQIAVFGDPVRLMPMTTLQYREELK